MKTHVLAAIAAGCLVFAPISSVQAQERPCMVSMSHLMAEGACKQRMGCLRTHLQLLSKACLTRLSAQNEKHFIMKHHKGARAA